jgi:hypothetical protein
MRTFSLFLNVLAICMIGYDAIIAGRVSLTQIILAASLGIGTIGLYLDRPSWFRTLAMVPLSFVAIFGLVFLAMFLYSPGDYGGWREAIRVVVCLAAIAVNVWVMNDLAPRSDRSSFTSS